ncbi:Arrestin C-terminal-like domain [Trinorchestia longiramus]|nr:Arrestin C-terminal-like domain [Trinorchestia longiramus]
MCDLVSGGCPVGPGFSLSKVINLTPLLADNRNKYGLALDGQLRDEDTNLASSTLVTDPAQKENLGIVVQYKVKVKLTLGALAGDLVAELPFTLMHPKPEEDADTQRGGACGSDLGRPSSSDAPDNASTDPAIDTNLIQLDADAAEPAPAALESDDIIFEDFARLRLKGETEA